MVSLNQHILHSVCQCIKYRGSHSFLSFQPLSQSPTQSGLPPSAPQALLLLPRSLILCELYFLSSPVISNKPSRWSRLWLCNYPLISLFTLSVDSLADTFYSIGLVMRLCQLLSILEILHILIGIDKSHLFPRFLQVSLFLKTLLPWPTHFSHGCPWGQAQAELPWMVHLHPSSRELGLLMVC